MSCPPSIVTKPWSPAPAPASAATLSGSRSTPVVLVVGFDGSEPSERALDGAAKLLADRSGWIEIVYVAHSPATAPIAPVVMGELAQSFDAIARKLRDELSDRLSGVAPLWHFRRRDGVVGHELIVVADELALQNPDATVVLVVGGSSHKIHRFLGSVASNLERVDRFPVIVVP